MNRRKFFSFLPFVAAVPIAATGKPVVSDHTVDHRGCVLRWTGWKVEATSDRLTGQWIAKRRDGGTFHRCLNNAGYSLLVASSGGGGVMPADIGFDFYSSQDSGRFTSTESSKEDLDRICTLTLDELKCAIDTYIANGWLS
jgi:hypothetical protein